VILSLFYATRPTDPFVPSWTNEEALETTATGSRTAFSRDNITGRHLNTGPEGLYPSERTQFPSSPCGCTASKVLVLRILLIDKHQAGPICS